MISVTEYPTFKFHLMHLMVDDCGSFGLKLCMVSGPEATASGPSAFACSSVRDVRQSS